MQAKLLNLGDLMGRAMSRTEQVVRKHHVSLNLKDGGVRDLGVMTDSETLYVQGYCALDDNVTSMTVTTTFTHPKEATEHVAFPNADEIVAAEKAAG